MSLSLSFLATPIYWTKIFKGYIAYNSIITSPKVKGKDNKSPMIDNFMKDDF